MQFLSSELGYGMHSESLKLSFSNLDNQILESGNQGMEINDATATTRGVHSHFFNEMA